MNAGVRTQALPPQCKDRERRRLDPRVRSAHPGPADDRGIVAMHWSFAFLFGDDRARFAQQPGSRELALFFVSPQRIPREQGEGCGPPRFGRCFRDTKRSIALLK